jgi:hypothetical protein
MERFFSITQLLLNIACCACFGTDLYYHVMAGELSPKIPSNSALALILYMSTLGFCMPFFTGGSIFVRYFRHHFSVGRRIFKLREGVFRSRLYLAPGMCFAFCIPSILLPPFALVFTGFRFQRGNPEIVLTKIPLPFDLPSYMGVVLPLCIIVISQIIPHLCVSYVIEIVCSSGEVYIRRRTFGKRRLIPCGRYISITMEDMTTSQISEITGSDGAAAWIVIRGERGIAPCATSFSGLSPAFSSEALRQLLPLWRVMLENRILFQL